MDVPKSVERLAIEVEGWLDLDCPAKALERMGPLLDTPGARPIALALRIRALVATGRYRDALADIDEVRPFGLDPEWLDVTEGWCRKRLEDVPAAIACMERLIARNPKSAIGHYNLGCYLALAGETDRAVDEVTVACGIDERFREEAEKEPDLDPLREDPRFRELLARG